MLVGLLGDCRQSTYSLILRQSSHNVVSTFAIFSLIANLGVVIWIQLAWRLLIEWYSISLSGINDNFWTKLISENEMYYWHCSLFISIHTLSTIHAKYTHVFRGMPIYLLNNLLLSKIDGFCVCIMCSSTGLFCCRRASPLQYAGASIDLFWVRGIDLVL
jgi:hypothetical protein